MGYSGRIVSVLFVGAILFFIRVTVVDRIGEPFHPFPLPAIVFLVLAWFLGKQYDKYVHISMTDPLTGVYNRRYVTKRFSRIVRYVNRKKLKLSILIIDVNDFKEINDLYGHDVGDQVLQEISGFLQSSFGKKDIIARWGGDEFIVLAVHSGKNEVAGNISNFKKLFLKEDRELIRAISVSIGMATYPTNADSLQGLVSLADANMYELKYRHRKDKMGK